MNVHSAGKIVVVDKNVHEMGNVSLFMSCQGNAEDGLPTNT